MKKDVRKCVRKLAIEQHEKSPHRYNLSANLKGAVIADVGAAEGCFTLDGIDQISHAYLFECDEAWIEPLMANFAPWKEKVTIVKTVPKTSHTKTSYKCRHNKGQNT